MPKQDFSKLEEMSDYSIALMDEIFSDIKSLSKNSSSTIVNKLDEVNKKIDRAREMWLNVDAMDKEVLDFRIVLFKRNIANRVDELNNNPSRYFFDISKIEQEYKELLKEKDIDFAMLKELMDDLKKQVIRWELILMIRNIKKSDWVSVYSIDQILDEINNAKQKGIDIEDIQEKLFE